jgi:hypothetical protein
MLGRGMAGLSPHTASVRRAGPDPSVFNVVSCTAPTQLGSSGSRRTERWAAPVMQKLATGCSAPKMRASSRPDRSASHASTHAPRMHVSLALHPPPDGQVRGGSQATAPPDDDGGPELAAEPADTALLPWALDAVWVDEDRMWSEDACVCCDAEAEAPLLPDPDASSSSSAGGVVQARGRTRTKTAAKERVLSNMAVLHTPLPGRCAETHHASPGGDRARTDPRTCGTVHGLPVDPEEAWWAGARGRSPGFPVQPQPAPSQNRCCVPVAPCVLGPR